MSRESREQAPTVSSAYYTDDAGRRYHESVHGDLLQDDAVYEAKAALASYRYFGDLAPEARIFEFGVGTGVNLHGLHAQARLGFDISATAIEACRKRGIDVVSSFGEVPDGAFDIVLCRHVLEHVETPLDLLRALRQKLAPAGQLLLVLPVERTAGYLQWSKKPDVNRHLYAWGPQHLANLLDAAGYRPVRYRVYWYSMQRILRSVRQIAGIRTYSAAVSLAGVVRRQREVAVWARAT
jgi:SAM-dependent methyltransferase